MKMMGSKWKNHIQIMTTLMWREKKKMNFTNLFRWHVVLFFICFFFFFAKRRKTRCRKNVKCVNVVIAIVFCSLRLIFISFTHHCCAERKHFLFYFCFMRFRALLCYADLVFEAKYLISHCSLLLLAEIFLSRSYFFFASHFWVI